MVSRGSVAALEWSYRFSRKTIESPRQAFRVPELETSSLTTVIRGGFVDLSFRAPEKVTTV